jgi:zinc/manganese transport system substrate-binding protein
VWVFGEQKHLLKIRQNLITSIIRISQRKGTVVRKTTYVIIVGLIVVIIIGGFTGLYLSGNLSSLPQKSGKLQIVAAENFWGSLITQLAGDQADVYVIVKDPNADPHEFESTTADAIAVADANYVVVNGAGYDDWAIKLVTANTNPTQKVLNIANLVGAKTGSNPHFWYNPPYVAQAIHQMYLDLVALNQSETTYFTEQYANLNASLAGYNQLISQIKQHYGGTEVAATESIFVYLANATGLNLVSPAAFMEAVSEGNDPPAQSIVQFQQQLQSGNVKVLVFNSQTVTPITDEMESIASQNNVTLVSITETVIPPTASFQDWMSQELITLQNALAAQTSGK